MVIKQYTFAMVENHLPLITMRKNNTSYSIGKNKNTKEALTDGSKCIGKKVNFAVVFTDITRRGALSKEASIYIPKRQQ